MITRAVKLSTQKDITGRDYRLTAISIKKKNETLLARTTVHPCMWYKCFFEAWSIILLQVYQGLGQDWRVMLPHFTRI